MIRKLLKLMPLNTVPIYADPVGASAAAEEFDELAASIVKVHPDIELVALPDHGRFKRDRNTKIAKFSGRRIG